MAKEAKPFARRRILIKKIKHIKRVAAIAIDEIMQYKGSESPITKAAALRSMLDVWLRAHERDEVEDELTALKTEVARLRGQR